MTSPTNLFRLPFAEDVSAGERAENLARQAAAQAGNINLTVPARLRFARIADFLETVSAELDADDLLASHAKEIA